MTEGIITPLKLTLNMANTESPMESVKINMKCHKCNRAFDTYNGLMIHRRRMHPDDYGNGRPFFMNEAAFTKEQHQMLQYLVALGELDE